MTKVCTFHNGVKDCRFDASLFPVTIGGSDTDILLPDVSPHDGVAYIDFSDKHAFIQPEERSLVFLNEKQLTESCWLNNGDRVRMGEAIVSCAISQEQITFHLLPPSADKTRVLQPPDVKEHQLLPAVEPQIETSLANTPSASSELQTKNKLTPKGVILASVFIVLLLLIGFVFLATPVTFNIDPEPDRVDLKDGLFSVEMADHFLIWPGKYRVKAEKQGYISLNETVFIDYGKSVKFDYQLQKLGGILTLSSEPVIGADVFIDDQSVGITPVVDIQVSPGQHNIVFKHLRYQSDEQRIEVEGEGRKQLISAKLIPNWAIVEIQSQPSSVTIKIDNIKRGNTPVKLELLAGKHLIRIEKKDFEPWEEEIAVIAGKNQHLPLVTLIKSPGILVLSSRPTGVNVLVDEQFKGQTPIKLKLKPELKHTIKLYKAGYEEITQTLEVKSGIEKKIDLQLRAKYGVINIKDIPTGAALYIDGKQQKNNKHSLKLTTRSHKLEVKKAGFQTFITDITPRTGFPQQVTIQLSPVIQAASPAAKALSTTEQTALVYVKPGRFIMGASRREQGRRSNEVLHEVKLTRSFYIGKKEVTNGEYKRFNPYHISGNAQGLSLDNDQQPVVNISWNDAAKYCNWLSEQNDLTPVYIEKQAGAMLATRPLSNGYRLPTEAEWVWAARYAGQSKPLKYPWGQSFPIVANSGNYASGDKYLASSPVAMFKANSLGLYDIGGNVSEWVNDYYSVIITGKSQNINPLGPATGKHHVIRGSSWRQNSITELRLSYRDYAQDKRSDLGFRVARYAD